MQNVIHIVDCDTPPDMQRQLDLLAAQGEMIVSFGPPPEYLASRRQICVLGRPLKFGPAIFLTAGSKIPPCRTVHFWSEQFVTPELAGADAKIVLSLPASGRRNFPYHRRILLTVPTAAAVRELILRGTPATHVSLLPPAGVPIADKAQRRQSVREGLHLKADDFLLLAVGPMIRPAGHKYACWAHAILREAHGNLRLLVPGTGRYESHVRYFAAGTGYKDETFFTGDKLPLEDCLAAADAAFFLCERDCGISQLVAAMAAGLPIVASNTPDVACCIENGQSGLLVPPLSPRLASAAMLRIIDDPSLAGTLGEAACRRAEGAFSLEQARYMRQEIYSARLAVP